MKKIVLFTMLVSRCIIGATVGEMAEKNFFVFFPNTPYTFAYSDDQYKPGLVLCHNALKTTLHRYFFYKISGHQDDNSSIQLQPGVIPSLKDTIESIISFADPHDSYLCLQNIVHGMRELEDCYPESAFIPKVGDHRQIRTNIKDIQNMLRRDIKIHQKMNASLEQCSWWFGLKEEAKRQKYKIAGSLVAGICTGLALQ